MYTEIKAQNRKLQQKGRKVAVAVEREEKVKKNNTKKKNYVKKVISSMSAFCFCFSSRFILYLCSPPPTYTHNSLTPSIKHSEIIIYPHPHVHQRYYTPSHQLPQTSYIGKKRRHSLNRNCYETNKVLIHTINK